MTLANFSRSVHRLRRAPFVFKVAIGVLLIAFVFGQWSQRQPAGAATRVTIALVAITCPKALPTDRHITVAEGAHALDRFGFYEITDRLARTAATVRCVQIAPAQHWVKPEEVRKGEQEHALRTR